MLGCKAVDAIHDLGSQLGLAYSSARSCAIHPWCRNAGIAQPGARLCFLFRPAFDFVFRVTRSHCSDGRLIGAIDTVERRGFRLGWRGWSSGLRSSSAPGINKLLKISYVIQRTVCHVVVFDMPIYAIPLHCTNARGHRRQVDAPKYSVNSDHAVIPHNCYTHALSPPSTKSAVPLHIKPVAPVLPASPSRYERPRSPQHPCGL